MDSSVSKGNIVYQDAKTRISLITPRLIRIERFSFTDLPTQTVFFRNLGAVAYSWNVSEPGEH